MTPAASSSTSTGIRTQEFNYKKIGCCDIVLDRERGLRLYRQYAMGARYEYNWFLR
jgi:hypothetical protein